MKARTIIGNIEARGLPKAAPAHPDDWDHLLDLVDQHRRRGKNLEECLERVAEEAQGLEQLRALNPDFAKAEREQERACGELERTVKLLGQLVDAACAYAAEEANTALLVGFLLGYRWALLELLEREAEEAEEAGAEAP